MNYIIHIFSFFQHIDKNILLIAKDYGGWTYLLLFAVIFCETGLVVTPFLPGDSLIFAMGAILPKTGFHFLPVYLLLCAAAVLGDTLNYSIGHFIGPAILEKEKVHFIKREHIERTQSFYEKYGRKTIIIARFIPIIRTFAPFIAGIGKMSYKRFISYNIIGGIGWITLFLTSGYLFGNIAFVSRNFTMIIYAIIGISLLPAIYEFARQRYEMKKQL